MQYVVSTQVMENYGSHCNDGKFSNGNAYWKMKGGNDYIVSDLDRSQDAMAFVMAAHSVNNIDWKEFPVSVQSYDNWVGSLPKDPEHCEFIMKNVKHIRPMG